jgi:DHA2 family multidrug resistance protein
VTPEAHKSVPFRGLVTISIMLATIMQVLDTTIANVALPHMQGSLSASQNQIAWVLTSYIIASAIMTLPVGWLSGHYGRKKVFAVSVTGFIIGSMLCGAATSIEQMVFFRILQGISGAALIPLSQSTLLDINPREKYGQAMALWGMGVMIGPILGPTLGGWLTEYYNWRWVFYINLPIGLLALAGVILFMPESERKDRKFDAFGFIMLSLLIGSFQLMIDRGQELDWFNSTEILLYCALIGASLWMYLVHTLHTDNPFLSQELFRDRNFVTSLFFIFLVGIILLASLALLPPYMQNLMGYPVIETGVIMAPRGVGVMLAMMITGRLTGKTDPRILILFGLGMITLSLYEMTTFALFVPKQTLIWTGVIQGVGLGFTFMPLSTLAYTTLDPKFRDEAAGLFSLVRNIGSSVGISMVMVLLTRNIRINHAYLTEYITDTRLGIPWQQVPQSIQDNLAMIPALVDGEITRQAAAIAYINDFKFMMWIVIATLPLLLFLKAPPKRPPAA